MTTETKTTTTTTPYPEGIVDDHARPVAGWRRHASPASAVIFGAVVVLGLFGVLGHEREWEASSGGASLTVHMPEVIRNGEFLEMRITVAAEEPIHELVIGIDQGLWEDLTINTMIPAATDETSENGEFRFTFAQLAANTQFLFKVDAQINPDILGGNEGMVTAYDGDVALVETRIEYGVLP
jgi:hypothetical protein